jgi:hypothetical protein
LGEILLFLVGDFDKGIIQELMDTLIKEIDDGTKYECQTI